MPPDDPVAQLPNGPFYSEAFFDTLSGLIDLTASERAILKDGLENAAIGWHRARLSADVEANPSALSKELNRLYRHTKEAAQTIRAMPEEVWEVLKHTHDFWEEYERAPHVAFTVDDDSGEGSHTIVDGQEEPSNAKTLKATPGELAHFLESLSWLAERPQVLFPPKKGPRRNYLLENWLRTVASVWANALHRPFIRGYIVKGVSNSDAAILCRSAYRELDPETPESQIENEMKKLISRSRGKIV